MIVLLSHLPPFHYMGYPMASHGVPLFLRIPGLTSNTRSRDDRVVVETEWPNTNPFLVLGIARILFQFYLINRLLLKNAKIRVS